MTRKEVSLLLYIESINVDNNCIIDEQKLNEDDRKILDKWNTSGYVSVKRIGSDWVKPHKHRIAILSEAAWADAASARRQRAQQFFGQRQFKTTEEMRTACDHDWELAQLDPSGNNDDTWECRKCKAQR